MAIVIIAVVAAVGLALAYHTFSFTITETSGSVDWGVYNESFPVGVQVSGSWTSANGVAIQFQIETSGGAIVQSYLEYTGPGSFSLTTNYSHYLFAVDSNQLTSVSVSGYYWAFW